MPPAGFWSNVVGSFGSFGSIVPLSVVLGMFALGWKIISIENTALITRLDTERQREQTKMDTERKVEQTRMDTERKAETSQMLTALQDTLASHLVELKTANAAEVERLVASEIADQRLVSVDDQAQVAKDIDAAVDRLSATTIHATWVRRPRRAQCRRRSANGPS